MLLQGFQIDKISPLEKKDKNSNEKQNILKAKNTNSFLKKWCVVGVVRCDLRAVQTVILSTSCNIIINILL